MAVKAGRVGVDKLNVDPKTGNIKVDVEPYELPVATSSVLGGVKPAAKTESMTQEVGVDSSGKLYVAPPETPTGGTKIYYKDHSVSTVEKRFNTGNINVSGYTPIGFCVLDKYSGYVDYATMIVTTSYAGETKIKGNLINYISTGDVTVRVYYISNSDLTTIPT